MNNKNNNKKPLHWNMHLQEWHEVIKPQNNKAYNQL